MKTFPLCLFLLVMLSALPPQAAAAAAAAENSPASASLIRFKQLSVDSDPNGFLRDWVADSSIPLCSWRGVICSGHNVVIGLNLSSMTLTGRLSLGDLIDLQTIRDLSFHNNHFYGNISFAVSADCSFETVDLSANNFSGAVTGHFLNSCSNLGSLNLSMNSITGGIFPYASSSLRVLDVSHNKISDSGLLNYALSRCESMTLLNFSNNKLAGGLRAAAPSCVNLTTIDLSYNQFSSGIPVDFIWGSSPSLKQLDLSHNNFSDDISRFDFGGCAAIASLDLSSNRLAGTIPPSLANCRNLQLLSLSGNEMTGRMPAFWPALTNLQRLFLADNRLTGEIPAELGQTCATLAELDLSGNQLTGGLPPSFTSCSSLQSLDLGNNQLSGHFIEQVISTMPQLRLLRLAFNNITGTVPLPALANCSTLELIDLSANMFTGVIPDGLCGALRSLRSLILPDNLISGTVPAELGNCTNLQEIDLSFNFLSGSIPIPVWSLPKLTDLIMWANDLSGGIPESLCSNGASLETLILSHNVISGGIPLSITRCSKLIWVALSGNRLVGDIPTGMGSLQSLAILQLGNNSLSGAIPPDLGYCSSLIWLDLNGNHLTGPVPSTLASQTGLIAPGRVSGKRFAFLRNAAGNICPGAGELFEFQGIRQERLAEFPLVHSCPATRIYTGTTVYSYSSNGSMIYLDLSYNSLVGTIPENFGFMNYLQVLNMGHNELTGMIPQSFGGLKSILGLDLSNNHLTGSIPGVLGTLTFLDDLDVSDNNLSGLIPSSGQLTTFPASRYDNNSDLCGLPLPPCGSRARDDGSSSSHTRQKRFSGGGSIVIGVALSLLIIFSLLLVLYKMKQQNLKEEQAVGYVDELHSSGASSWKLSGVLEPLSINVATFEKPLKKLTFAHLLEATNGFSADSLIGTGGFGEVYKARLKDGSVVAIKKLIQATGQGDREFTAEMETIGKIKHRNLVPLLGYCKIGEERLLIYEYMKHGSLDMVLNNKSKGGIGKLDWPARKKIAIGAARGLAFLHHSCIPHIIHRDMKSSNVLLDENMEARVSDFGMARLMNALDTHLSVSTLAGTPGYVPPEYYQSFRCTTKGDVYSYGVVLLELITGKKPVDQSEFGDNNLVGWTKQMIQENRNTEIFDPVLMGKKSGEAELYRYLKIAGQCLDDRPLRRPTMIQVMAMFKELQVDSDSDFLEGLSIGRTIIEDSREKT